MDKLRQKREQECIEKYMKKLTVVSKAKRTAFIIGGAALLGGACGTGGYFAYKAMTTKPGIVVAEEFIIEFNTDGGTELEAKKFEKGKVVDLSQFVPKKEGYIFQGWYFDKEFKNKCPREIKIEQNTKIYAMWEHEVADVGLGYILNPDGQSYSIYCADEDKLELTDGELVIPDCYDGLPITSLGYYDEASGLSIGFKNCSKIKILNLKNTKNITRINNEAFKNCVILSKIEGLPSSLTHIGASAFENCFTLSSVGTKTGLIELGNSSIVEIGENAFANDYVIEIVAFPDSLLKLGKAAFTNCYSLTTVNFVDACIREIPESCFKSCENLINIRINVDTVKFGNNAFKDCLLSNLKLADNFSSWSDNDDKVIDPKDLPTQLTEGTAIHKVAFIDETTGLSFYFTGEYDGNYYCSVADSSSRTSKDLEIPSTIEVEVEGNEKVTLIVERIAEYGFYNSNLTSVTIPNSVWSISDNAFMMCMDLKTIEFEDDSILQNIGDNAFRSCAFEQINLPDTLDTIGNNAFCFSSITSINIPSKVSEIKYSTIEVEDPSSGNKSTTTVAPFYGCHKLKQITVEENEYGYYSDDNGVLYKNYSENYNSLLRCPEDLSVDENTFTLPNDVTEVTPGALYGMKNITKVIINQGCKWIYDRAFSCDSGSTTSIKEIEFEENSLLEYIAPYAFSKTNISSINLPSNLLWIYDYAFYSCSSLKSITIPASVTYIGNAVFRGSGLSSSSTITFEDTTSLWTVYNVKTGEKRTGYSPVDQDGKTTYETFSYLKGITSGTYYWEKEGSE